MKRMVLLILVFLLMMDLAEDGCLGKAVLYFPTPSTKTCVTSQHHHAGLSQDDYHSALTSPELPGKPYSNESRPTTLSLPLSLQIMHCCHLSSSGGLPL
jgi:hypothetical protein